MMGYSSIVKGGVCQKTLNFVSSNILDSSMSSGVFSIPNPPTKNSACDGRQNGMAGLQYRMEHSTRDLTTSSYVTRRRYIMTTYLCVEYLSFSFGLDTPVMSDTYTTQYTANNMHTRQIVIPKKIILKSTV